MHLVCPKVCNEVSKQCTNNTDCRKMRETIFKECKNILSWDGNLPKPNCTDECMKWVNSTEIHPIMKHLMCCISDKDDQTDNALHKRNLETICGAKLDSGCQNKKKACEAIRAKEDNIHHRGIHKDIIELTSVIPLSCCLS